MYRAGLIAWALMGCSGQALAQASANAQSVAPAEQTTVNSDTAPAEASATGDIVVTAQRREERLQDVPISVTAVSGSQLAEAGVDDVTELQRLAPSLFVSPGALASSARITIRGIGSVGGTAVEPSVAAFVDGIYIPAPAALLGSLFDVERIEVLNGPQGTLFGRNATVGALSFVTQQPRFENSAEATVEYGTFDRVRVLPVLNVAASDKLAFRIAGLYDRTDDFIRNVLTGQRVGDREFGGFRVSGRYSDGPLEWVLRGDYQRTTGDGVANINVIEDSVTPTAAANFVARTRGLNPILDDTYGQRIRAITGGSRDDRNYGVVSDLSYELGEGHVIRSLTGYRVFDGNQFEQELLGTGLSVLGRSSPRKTRTLTQELQFLSPTDRSFTYVLGAYYLNDDYHSEFVINQGPDFCTLLVANPAQRAVCLSGQFPTTPGAVSEFDQKTESYAGYGQATYEFAPGLALTLGGRYTRDEKSLDLLNVVPNVFLRSLVTPDTEDLDIDEGRFTYRASATYKPNDDILIFANYSTGYKSGGFDVGGGVPAAANRIFRSEKSDNIELGFKSQFLDRRVTANVTLFRLTVDDFQLRSFDPAIGLFGVRNAGSIRQQGVDFDLSVRPTTGLTLGMVATVLDSEYTSFANAPNRPGLAGVQDLTGQRATFSPKYRGVLSADYRTPIGSALEANASADLTITSRANIGLEADNNRQAIEPGYSLLGARVGLGAPGGRWQVFLQGENLTDKGYCTARAAQTLGAAFGLLDGRGNSVQTCYVGTPRTVRVGVSTRF